MHYNTCSLNEPLEDLDYFNIDGYKYDGFLGCSNAPVYRFVDIQNNEILLALKELKIKDEDDYQRVVNNFRTLQRIKQNKHPNIIEILGFCKAVKQKAYGEDVSAYLVMEHCEGNLDDYIQMKKKSGVSFTLTEIKKFFSQTLSSLEFMQTNLSIAHRDIKPENILVDKTNFKVADLDDSKIDLNKTVEKSLILGTLSFMAPELLKAYNRMKDRLSYNAYRSDVYSLGLCLLYMCTFYKFTRNERMDGVTNKSKYQEQIKTLRQNVKEKYGSVLSKLLKIMLEMDPILRPDFKSLKKSAIDRGFLERCDFYRVENNSQNQKRQQISIDLNRASYYENNLTRIKQHCILSDSDGTTAHYSSEDNYETSEGSQRAQEYQLNQQTQQNSYHYNCHGDQIHYNSQKGHIQPLSMQKQCSHQNSRQHQLLEHSEKKKSMSSSYASREPHQMRRIIQEIDQGYRSSCGNIKSNSQMHGEWGQTFSFNQQRMLENNNNIVNFQSKQIQEGYDQYNNPNTTCIDKTKSQLNAYPHNFNQSNSIARNYQIARNNKIFGGMYAATITEPILEYNSMKNQDERSNTDRTISQQSNWNEPQANQDAIQKQPTLESRTDSQQSYVNNQTQSHQNNSLYPESQISNSEIAERQDTFTVSQIIRVNNNNKFQQQLNNNQYLFSDNINQNQEIPQQEGNIHKQQQQHPDFHNDGQYYYFKDDQNIDLNAGIDNQQGKKRDKLYSSRDKQSKQTSKNKCDARVSQKQNKNSNSSKDINIFNDGNQTTCISKKMLGQNKMKIVEDDNSFFETFLESSTPSHYVKQANYYRFKNPDQVMKLSKQRKRLTIVIVIMILITIALGLFYFLQKSSSSNNSDNNTNSNGNNSNDDDIISDDDVNTKTYTVEECRSSGKMYLLGKCYAKCPQQNYYSDIQQQICVQCDPSCLECTWGEANSCKRCKNDLYLLTLNQQSGMCVSDCPNYYRKDNLNNRCIRCPENCLSCTSSSSLTTKLFLTNLYSSSLIVCDNCASNFYLLGDNLCINVCPKDTITDYQNRKCVTSIMHFTEYLSLR